MLVLFSQKFEYDLLLLDELSYENMQLFWTNEVPFDVSDNFLWNGFNMIDHKLENISVTYTHIGTFSKVVATFYLRRIFGQFLLDIYVPIFLYVIISWGSFWVEVTAAPARVTLGVTVLLTMVTASRTAREKLPPVSYIHALDIWITVCIFFVFGVIIEYTVVNYIFFREKRSLLKKNKRLKSLRRRQNYEQRRILNSNSQNNSQTNLQQHNSMSNLTFNGKYESDQICTLTSADDVSFTISSSSPNDNYFNSLENTSNNNNKPSTVLRRIGTILCRPINAIRRRTQNQHKFDQHKKVEGGEEISYEIDRISRIAFPTLFFVFNLIYWLVITIASHHWIY